MIHESHQIIFASIVVGTFIMQAQARADKAHFIAFIWAMAGWVAIICGIII